MIDRINRNHISDFFMKGNLFFWLKSYFGFSNKESRGFLFLLPFLTILILFPSVLDLIKKKESAEFEAHYLKQIDSLEKAGIQLLQSPDPVFNYSDTIKGKSESKQSENLNRISILDADSVTLQIVPGIGPGLAGRIIKYKIQLGGFHSPDQLLEVYGLKEETVQELWNYFEFEPLIFQKLNINNLEVADLAKHPYISYAEAKVIFAYRNQHGNYRSADDLKQIKIFKESWIDQLRPYLAF